MDQRTADRGLSSIQFILASALALLLFLALANLVVVQYGRGAVRSALEQGARAGAVTGSVLDCEVTAAEVTRQLLGGRMSDGLVVACQASDGMMVATGTAIFESWTPLTGDFAVELTSRAVLEWGP